MPQEWSKKEKKKGRIKIMRVIIRGGIKMAEDSVVELTFSHRHIGGKKKSTCKTLHTEYLLNTSRRRQTSKKGKEPCA